ncbi:MAG TPA: c-type cytochrome [Mucilaginibacter sp.]
MKNKGLIASGLLLAGIIVVGCKTHFDTTTSDYKAVVNGQNVEHGKALAFTICGGCHYNHGTNKFTGNPIPDVPGIAGKVYSANLTHSVSRGMTAKYSDAQIRYLLKIGIADDGRFLSYMLRPNIADEDVNDIIAFLRSNDPSVSASDQIAGVTHYTLIGKMYNGFEANPAPYRTNVKRPTGQVALGRYLVDNVGCYHCHSKSLRSLNSINPEQTKGYLAGGIRFKGWNGTDVVASNITPDKNTGIGNYSKEDFLKAIKHGKAPDRTLKPPMERFEYLTDKEIDAIYAYIMTLPPKNNAVKRI